MEDMAPQHPDSHIPPLADLPIDIVSALLYLELTKADEVTGFPLIHSH